ncbi:MAG: MFS transporter [Bryobacteraceae bacterium]
MSTNTAEAIPKIPQKIANDPRARVWAGGFLVVGVLVGLLGSLLIAWQYHIDTDPRIVGLHFLALNLGYVIAVAITQRLLGHVSIRFVALLGCGIGFASLLALSFAAPPASPLWRILGLGFVGWAGGALVTALLYVLEPRFEESPASVANLAGALFGFGCLISTLMGGFTYFAGSVQRETALLALIPLIFFVLYALNKYPGALGVVRHASEQAAIRETLRDLRSVAAVLFSLLLFFQFGSEWAIAGWLPLFLIHKLGANPVWAIFALALYFLSIMVGRLLARRLLPRVSHKKLLVGSIVVAMAGYLLLSFTRSMPGAWLASVVIGAGFAPIYPLVEESLDDRFSYHPGFYNGIFSIAITGGMSAPWLLGYVDAYLGIQYVMLLPALGSIAVLILTLLIMLEAHLMGGSKSRIEPKASAAAAGKS